MFMGQFLCHVSHGLIISLNLVITHIGNEFKVKRINVVLVIHQILIIILSQSLYLNPLVALALVGNNTFLSVQPIESHHGWLVLWLVLAIIQEVHHSIHSVFVVGIYDLVFLKWTQVKHFFAKVIFELLLIFIKFLELVFYYLYIIWVLQINIHLLLITIILDSILHAFW